MSDRAGYEGGKHQGGWGTENVIIPLGQGYLEIAAVFDPVAAQTCDWGKCVFRFSPKCVYCATARTSRFRLLHLRTEHIAQPMRSQLG